MNPAAGTIAVIIKDKNGYLSRTYSDPGAGLGVPSLLTFTVALDRW